MTELNVEYPALYKGASTLSKNSQDAYHRLLKSEYSLLIVAAAISMVSGPGKVLQTFHAIVFIALAVLLLYRAKTKPEQDWYKGRALAESIKTSTWRYCMRAAPFGDAADIRVRRAEFRNILREILQANHHIGSRIPPDSAADDQITSSMDLIRALSLKERRKFYSKKRIKEQRIWYVDKAGVNKRSAKRWVIACAVTYGVAIALLVIRPSYPQWTVWPFEPLIVMASSIIGWMQIKKFNELTSAYTLTAHEIGIIQGRLDEADTEEEFSEFVNEAELAFSREHTQWVARQNAL
ncbi:DUF4231 domain-containing protein [Xanthomonas euvesicatoria]|uniref:DUF4231 domain-containing protein n=1 Tax=Xanthomonas euvesicatoria TaxID=456327 RepID=UPI001C47D9E5|nr:DUF4231 domain-containing protein [Xanthomonas euvesicatoria]MBV6896547.1 DUF4231 domain-containing protein [Xanthomonas campestris pv. ionidii]